MERYLTDLERVFRFFKANKNPDGISKLMEMRGYFSEEMRNFLEEYGVVLLNEGTDVEKLKNLKSNINLFSEKGNFLLEGRFIIPIKDLTGRVISFVGWYPDDRKYITIKTKLFQRNYLLFGMEQLPCETLFVCEGIFDSLHLRANGFNAVSVMGADISLVQREWCRLTSEIWGIPDNDNIGRRTVKNNKWDMPYLVWYGLKVDVPNSTESISIKDIDTLCNLFDVKDVLNNIPKNSLNRVINLTNY